LLIIFALPFVLLGAGFLTPGAGYFGISFTTSGVGIVLGNLFMAFIGGGLCGAVMAYLRREAIWVVLGPIAGYLMTATMLDIGMPWYVGLIAIAGPPLALLGGKVVAALGIDDPKVAPLVLGVCPIGVIVTGIVMWGTKTGGYPGLEGEFGFQHAEITPWTQALGVAVSIGFAAIIGLVLAFVLERTTGLRVSEEDEIVGLDQAYWGTDNFGREVLDSEHIPDPEETAVGTT
jgi:ammonium transporter, Amt family